MTGDMRGQSTLLKHASPDNQIQGAKPLNNLASMDRLIPPSQEKSLDMTAIKEVNDYQQNDSLNEDLRNFKSSSNLIKQGLQTTRNRGAGAEDKRVIFKDLPDMSQQVRIAEDDVDSVQHLDLSVLDDND